jgi:hypothetical protein
MLPLNTPVYCGAATWEIGSVVLKEVLKRRIKSFIQIHKKTQRLVRPFFVFILNVVR